MANLARMLQANELAKTELPCRRAGSRTRIRRSTSPQTSPSPKHRAMPVRDAPELIGDNVPPFDHSDSDEPPERETSLYATVQQSL